MRLVLLSVCVNCEGQGLEKSAPVHKLASGFPDLPKLVFPYEQNNKTYF